MSSPEFHRENSSCLHDVIKKGYAEKVPLEQPQGTPGKVWYTPHHGIYHPKKGSLQVVLDGGARYQGASLNGELLQLLQNDCLLSWGSEEAATQQAKELSALCSG